MYSFLWEQDVSATFSDFLRGQAAPHPRRFTRPETVRSRASARVHSGRPRRSVHMYSIYRGYFITQLAIYITAYMAPTINVLYTMAYVLAWYYSLT